MQPQFKHTFFVSFSDYSRGDRCPRKDNQGPSEIFYCRKRSLPEQHHQGRDQNGNERSQGSGRPLAQNKVEGVGVAILSRGTNKDSSRTKRFDCKGITLRYSVPKAFLYCMFTCGWVHAYVRLYSVHLFFSSFWILL